MPTEVHPISTISDNGEPPYFSWICSCGKRVGGYHTSVRAFTAGEQHVEDAHPGSLRQWRTNEAAATEQLRAELESVRAERDAAVEEQRAIRHENAVREGWRQEALADRDRLRAIVAELVRLKDGPRDDAYRAAKDAAWDRARAELPVSAPGDRNFSELTGHPLLDVDGKPLDTDGEAT